MGVCPNIRRSTAPIHLACCRSTMKTLFARAITGTDLLCIGSYGYDRSIVCIDRTTLEVSCFVGKDFTRTPKAWQSLDDWLVSEIQRVCRLHDELGNCLVDKKQFLPEG